MLVFEDKAGNIKFIQEDSDNRPVPVINIDLLDAKEETPEIDEDLENDKEKKDA